MRSVVDSLSKCVVASLVNCSDDDLRSVVMFYEAIFSGPYCERSFINQMFAELLPAGQCYVPQCSHMTALICLNEFKASEGDSCGYVHKAKW